MQACLRPTTLGYDLDKHHPTADTSHHPFVRRARVSLPWMGLNATLPHSPTPFPLLILFNVTVYTWVDSIYASLEPPPSRMNTYHLRSTTQKFPLYKNNAACLSSGSGHRKVLRVHVTVPWKSFLQGQSNHSQT